MMLRIPTYLAESKISGAGLGVFCKEFVSAGTIIWTFHAGFDYIVDELPQDEIQRDFVSPFQVRSATVQHRRHGGVNGRGKGQGQGL